VSNRLFAAEFATFAAGRVEAEVAFAL